MTVLLLSEKESDLNDLTAVRSFLSTLSIENIVSNDQTSALQLLQSQYVNQRPPKVSSSSVRILILLPQQGAVSTSSETTSPVSETTLELLQKISTIAPSLFCIVFSLRTSYTLHPVGRLQLAQNGAHMVSHVTSDVTKQMEIIRSEKCSGEYRCPLCGKEQLTQEELCQHMPQYHIHTRNISMRKVACPICKKDSGESLIPHVVETHSASSAHSARNFLQFVTFGLCVIQRKSDKKFLVVQEYANQGYWLPGGGIDSGEFPSVAAKRECLEEAGLNVELTGILRVEYSNARTYGRMRYIFFGHPVSEEDPCKTFPDFESYGACWVSLEDLANPDIRWRGPEPLQYFQYVANGGHIAPISMLAWEGTPP